MKVLAPAHTILWLQWLTETEVLLSGLISNVPLTADLLVLNKAQNRVTAIHRALLELTVADVAVESV